MHIALRDHDAAVPSEPLNFEGISPSFSQTGAECMSARMDYAILRKAHGVTQSAKLFAWPVSRQLFSTLCWEHRLCRPGSKGKIKDAFKTIEDLDLVDAELGDGGRRYVARFQDPTKKTWMSEELLDIEAGRQARKNWTQNTQEMVREILFAFSACFDIKGKQSDGQLNIDCPYCGHNTGLLQPSKGRRGSFSCNYCRKGGPVARVLSKKDNITETAAWELLNSGGRSTYPETPIFEDISI